MVTSAKQDRSLDPAYEPYTIDPTRFQQVLEQYPDVVGPELVGLEHKRFHLVPAVLAQRLADGRPYLDQDEVITLVDWKLAHGTLRPSLRSLVSSNAANQILRTTEEAFALLPTDLSANNPDLGPSISKLSTLRGIGPATASLILNTRDPTCIPFFSDELYRWLRYSDPEDKKSKGTGWARKIGYTVKEYVMVVKRTRELRTRMEAAGRSVSAIELEKVAYVLGRRGVRTEPKRAGFRHEELDNSVQDSEHVDNHDTKHSVHEDSMSVGRVGSRVNGAQVEPIHDHAGANDDANANTKSDSKRHNGAEDNVDHDKQVSEKLGEELQRIAQQAEREINVDQAKQAVSPSINQDTHDSKRQRTK